MAAPVQPVVRATNLRSKYHSKKVNTSRQCQKTHNNPTETTTNMNASDNCRFKGLLRAGLTSLIALGAFSSINPKVGARSRANRWRSIFLSSARATSNLRLVSPWLRAASKAAIICLLDQIICLRQLQDRHLNDNRIYSYRRVFRHRLLGAPYRAR